MAAAPKPPQRLSSQLSRVESFQYPHGHVGHLQGTQEGSLAEFKKLCQEKGYYKPASGDHPASHDDETLLRYLRARKFKPAEAFGQFKDTEDWRKENKIDELYETIDVDEYDEARRLYPQWTGRRDKRGIPVYVYEVAGLSSKKIADYRGSGSKATSVPGRTPPRLLRLFALYENLTRFVLPLCTGIASRPNPETPVSQSNNIVDISGVGLKQFWDLKNHMQDASQLATAHYPETLDRIFIIGAPSFFPTVWSWIKRWFDPITVSKIFILSKSDMMSTFEKYIDRDNIPKRYGGNLEWEWGELPKLEPEIEESLKWINPTQHPRGGNCFPPGPIRWDQDSNGQSVAIAVGTEKGTARHVQTASLVDALPDDVLAGAETVDFGEPSTTGEHTHPADDVEYFPPTGDTPPESDENPALDSDSSKVWKPARESKKGESTDPGDAHPREGTSSTKYLEQEQTLARGQLAEGTPVKVDWGHGDTTSTIEPATIGQAPKKVDIPEAQPAQAEGESTYVGQAKAAAGSAAAAVGSVGSSVLAVVGLGGKKTEDEGISKEETTKPEDSRVDSMKNKDVEEFIRDKYSTSSGPKKS